MAILENSRHEKFAQEIAKGTGQRDAYKAAGYSAANASAADASASRLLSQDKIRARVQELKSRAADEVIVTKSWIIQKLVENLERALQAKPVLDAKGNPTGDYTYQGSVANRALELLGKERGMFIDKKEIGRPGEFDAMSDSDLDAFIQQEAAELLATTKRSATKH